MKKNKLIFGICAFTLFVSIVYALNFGFNFDFNSSKLNNTKKNNILNNFDESYKLTYKLENSNSEEKEKQESLVKKTTYLLLGYSNSKDETNEEYYKRHQDYLDLALYNHYKKEGTVNKNYADMFVNVSAIAIPSMFSQMNSLGLIYNNYKDIRVNTIDDLVIASITLTNVSMNAVDNSKYEYTKINNDIVMYYYFVKVNNEYYLAYVYGEITDEVSNYLEKLEENEVKKVAVTTYASNATSVYNYDKLNNMPKNNIVNTYLKNKDNIIYLDSIYNTSSVGSANGIFINDGLVLTTWSFLEKALINAQDISIRDNYGVNYKLDGIVTINAESNLAVLKLTEKSGKHVTLGNDNYNVEDPVMVLSSKTGTGLVTQKGIIISKDGYIQTSIPLSETDEGSPLFNSNGEVIGLNTSLMTNASISSAINVNALRDVQNKFNNINFNDIKTIKFEELKSKYYYVKYTDDKVIDEIPRTKWNKYKKIGNIENTINLELVKANYKDGIVSLRYKNNVSSYMSTINLTFSFRDALVKEGYKLTLDSTSKMIYTNDSYKVIIMEEFDYLIVVMVKL